MHNPSSPFFFRKIGCGYNYRVINIIHSLYVNHFFIIKVHFMTLKGVIVLNKRLKEIRQELGLNQEAFASKIGLIRSTISNIETGNRNLTDRVISDICREFNVNEEWLRNGIGEMFIETDNTLISQLAKEYKLNDFEIKMIETYVKLPQNQRDAISNYMRFLSNETSATNLDDTSEIDEEVENYRLELTATKKAKYQQSQSLQT